MTTTALWAGTYPPGIPTIHFWTNSASVDDIGRGAYELSDPNLQEAASIAVGDLLFVGRAHRESLQEIARCLHRRIRIVGGEQDPIDSHLKQQVKKSRGIVETTESVREVLAETRSSRSFQMRLFSG